MKILWLINIPLPEASHLLNESPSPYGGWLINASKDVSNQDNTKLGIAFTKKGTKETIKLKGEKIDYYVCKPVNDKDKELIIDNSEFRKILKEFKPDLVHIYGTELAHSLSMVNACEKENIKNVISIQGLVSIYAQHMYANLPFRAIYGFTLRNILRRDNVWLHKNLFINRGKNEIEALKKTRHVIGRTTWDKACTEQINPLTHYHICNETLRDEFYNYKWNIDECEKNSIFLSQGQYPIKGLHYMIEAMPIILKKFPDTKVYISGKDITKSESVIDKSLITYYGKYIKKLINKYNLKDRIIFTGPLDEKEMRKRYLKSNVFVCPSSIENSPNSLGEAMILGVPSIASSIGGVSDLLEHKKEGFIYQTDAPYMLAHYVSVIFENNETAKEISHNARLRALKTHDRTNNLTQLLNIYREIISINM